MLPPCLLCFIDDYSRQAVGLLGVHGCSRSTVDIARRILIHISQDAHTAGICAYYVYVTHIIFGKLVFSSTLRITKCTCIMPKDSEGSHEGLGSLRSPVTRCTLDKLTVCVLFIPGRYGLSGPYSICCAALVNTSRTHISAFCMHVYMVPMQLFCFQFTAVSFKAAPLLPVVCSSLKRFTIGVLCMRPRTRRRAGDTVGVVTIGLWRKTVTSFSGIPSGLLAG